MEKQGVIKPGVTPPENDDTVSKKTQQKTAAVVELDNDFRKRAADAVTRK